MSTTKTSTTRPSHEAIRVAPLHQPKSRKPISVAVSGSVTAAAASSRQLEYNGGPLLRNAEVVVIYWGAQFKDGELQSLTDKLDVFFDSILTSPMMDQLHEYSTKKYSIGPGKRVASVMITAGAPKGHISDSAIQKQLRRWISGNTIVPKPNENTIYFLYLEHGVSVSMGGSRSCSSFCGYHDAIDNSIFYAVMPYPSCSGCRGDLDPFEALCATSSHELCEAITDPIPGTGWYNEEFGEVGDICAWQFKSVRGYVVQKEWSNKLRRCV